MSDSIIAGPNLRSNPIPKSRSPQASASLGNQATVKVQTSTTQGYKKTPAGQVAIKHAPLSVKYQQSMQLVRQGSNMSVGKSTSTNLNQNTSDQRDLYQKMQSVPKIEVIETTDSQNLKPNTIGKKDKNKTSSSPRHQTQYATQTSQVRSSKKIKDSPATVAEQDNEVDSSKYITVKTTDGRSIQMPASSGFRVKPIIVDDDLISLTPKQKCRRYFTNFFDRICFPISILLNKYFNVNCSTIEESTRFKIYMLLGILCCVGMGLMVYAILHDPDAGHRPKGRTPSRTRNRWHRVKGLRATSRTRNR